MVLVGVQVQRGPSEAGPKSLKKNDLIDGLSIFETRVIVIGEKLIGEPMSQTEVQFNRSLSDLWTLLFHKKVCPSCGAKLVRHVAKQGTGPKWQSDAGGPGSVLRGSPS
jgi:hypothetical protein